MTTRPPPHLDIEHVDVVEHHPELLAVRLLHQHLQHLALPVGVAGALLYLAVHAVLWLRPQLNLNSTQHIKWIKKPYYDF